MEYNNYYYLFEKNKNIASNMSSLDTLRDEVKQVNKPLQSLINVQNNEPETLRSQNILITKYNFHKYCKYS